MTDPTMSLFRKSPGGWGKWGAFVAALEPNTPTATGNTAHWDRGAGSLRKAAAAAGKPVSLRMWEGELWACWIVEDETAS